MKQADTPHKYMVRLGKWLEDFLSERTDFMELATSAIDLLNINFDLETDTVSFPLLNEAVSRKANPEESAFYRASIILGEQEERLEQAKKSLLGKYTPDDAIDYKDVAKTYSIDNEIDQTDRIYSIFWPCWKVKEAILAFLRVIRNRKEKGNWYELKIYPDSGFQQYINLPEDEALSFVAREDFQVFQQCYSGLIDTLDFEKNQLVINRAFNQSSDVFNWPTVATRIFFEFLENGGQDNIGFCEHCGNFFCGDKKGRRKYCKDSCRMFFHKEKDRPSKKSS